MQFGEVDAQIRHLEQILHFLTVRVVDHDTRRQHSENYLTTHRHYTVRENYEILSKWQHFWDQEATGSHYRSIEKKTVSTKIKYLHPSRHTEVIITRLRLGKCCLNAYLHQIGKHKDGLCHHCGKPETVTHFLTECPNNATCSAVVAASK